MKKLTGLYFLLVFLFSFFSPDTVCAQSITGTWKRAASLIEKSDGSKSDAYPAQQKSMPCASTITYTFTPDGRIITKAADCGKMQDMLESMNGQSTFKQAGNKLTITTKGDRIPQQVYTLSFKGNTMTWDFNYADNPKTANPTKAKSMSIVYKR